MELKKIAENLIQGKAAEVEKLTRQAIEEKIEVKKILNEGMIAGMSVVGDKFKNGEFYVPEVLVAARAMHSGMNILKPLLTETGVEPIGTVVMGTVRGDLHDIGKKLVAMMLEGAGFKIVDLGTDVEPEKFVNAAKTEGAQLIGMSALLTTTMVAMKETIDEMKKAGLSGVKTMVGGAPITQAYAEEIGADGYAPNASLAVEKAKELLKRR